MFAPTALRGLVLALILGLPAAAAPSRPGPPQQNVLVIVLDDVGLEQLALYDDVNHYSPGSPYPYAPTPNLDALAADGVRFLQARAYALCSPSRAAAQSGHYGFRTGVGETVRPEHVSPTFFELGTPPAPPVVLMPELANALGYATGAFGKWHLGLEKVDGGTGNVHPNAFGWQHFSGVMRNLDDEPRPPEHFSQGHLFTAGYYNYYRVIDGVSEQLDRWAPLEQRLAFVEWAEEHEDQPWLAWVGLSSCHGPYEWPPDGTHSYGDLWPDGTGVIWEHFRAMLEATDREVGMILAGIAAQLDRTTVIVIGDNGTQIHVVKSALKEGQDMGGYTEPIVRTRFKGTVFESGIRVPLIVAGAQVDQPGRSCTDLVDFVDLYATVHDLLEPGAAQRMAPIDGLTIDSTSFADAIRQADGHSARDFAFSERFGPNGTAAPVSSARAYAASVPGFPGTYKLVRISGEADRLYRVDTDPLETTLLDLQSPVYGALSDALDDLLASP